MQELKVHLTDRSKPDPSFQVYLLYDKPAQTLSTVICRMDSSVATFQTIESFLKPSPVQENEAADRSGFLEKCSGLVQENPPTFARRHSARLTRERCDGEAIGLVASVIQCFGVQGIGRACPSSQTKIHATRPFV